jgi:hypothetical protein
MRKTIWLALVIAALGLSVGPAGAADDLWVVVGGVRMQGMPISSVPYTINNSGYYYLTADLTLSSGGTGIYLMADNVTINLMGYSLSYGGPSNYWSVGVWMNGHSNVEVRNGTVRGFTQGGIMENSSAGAKNRVINVRALNNIGHGIFLHGSGHLVENCTAAHNNVGIWIDSGEISGCVSANNSMGIWLQGPGSVLDNAVSNNTSYNFYLGNGVATSLLADGNSSYGLSTNYRQATGTTGSIVITANNAGKP